MPRKIRSPDAPTTRRASRLAGELAEELRSGRESGQPFVDEEHFKTGAVRVVVLWDRWDHRSAEDRSKVILDAYRMAEGDEFASRIGLVNGLTIPEAHASGLLPVQIIAAIREGDPVTPDQCRRAMIDEGASILQDPDRPQLRFATEGEAEAARARLSDRLPGSGPVWLVLQEVGASVGMSWDMVE